MPDPTQLPHLLKLLDDDSETVQKSLTAAFAATDATAVTDLNLRAGPSSQSAVIGVIPRRVKIAI